MRLYSTITFLGWLSRGALAAMVKEGSTCTVTPESTNEKRAWPHGTPPIKARAEDPSINVLQSREPQFPGGGQRVDDTPSILSAFKECGQDGHIIIEEGDYMVRQIMDVPGLKNVHIDIYGHLEWSGDNIQYWLSNSLPVTYAARSTAWRIGGTNITMLGHGKALFFGNGQIWYDQNRDQSNQNGRPISLTLWYANDVFIDGITWRQSQFWNTFIAHSQNITMTNIDMNSTSASQWGTVNTDGTDTWNSRDVVLKNWTVTCGDDCISVKGNSTNISVSNATCYESGCMVIGSMGNPPSQAEYVDDVVFENVFCRHSSNAAWIKTYPGVGHVRNVTFRNIAFEDVNQPIYVSPCIYSGQNCDNSRIPITDITWQNITGTSRYNIGAGMYCSRSSPCQNFRFEDIDIRSKNGDDIKFLCSNIANQNSMGLQCTGPCPSNFPQQLNGNR
ncbi:uncharacterized protein DNG_08961 [Cephalotrichum gorgonifer]|uniref:galacturonan 1,4-alpha-galacturonidase n=1 Tax=Cephalotrichum gorgonifer TaxID=2041049 RepID=A0AAE8SZQ3_9PEZI|nr:uncharacterized protein DNG_08961 [Cephalotrichum gorgonifer]